MCIPQYFLSLSKFPLRMTTRHASNGKLRPIKKTEKLFNLQWLTRKSKKQRKQKQKKKNDELNFETVANLMF